MTHSLSLSLAVSQEKESEASLSSLTEDQRRSPVLSTLFLSLLHAYIYTHTHIHIELDIFWVCLIISFYGVTECRVDVVGVHITATHSVPSTDCQNLHTRELSQ